MRRARAGRGGGVERDRARTPGPFMSRPKRESPGELPGASAIFNARAAFDTGGEGGIRTHGTLAGTTVFETVLFNRSSTSPPVTLHELRAFAQVGGRACYRRL